MSSSHRDKASERMHRQRRSALRRKYARLLDVGVLLVVVGAMMGVLLWAHHPAQAQTVSSPTNSGSALKSSSTPTPAPATGLLRFIDAKNATSLIVQTDLNDPNAGVFTFMTPAGDQYHGGQQSDLSQSGNGVLQLLFDGSVQFIPAQTGASTGAPTTVNVHVHAVIHPQTLQAEAELHEQQNQGQHFTMITQVPGNQDQVVTTYNQALVNQDWTTVYSMTSQDALGGLTEADFAQQMTQQDQVVGTITSVVVNSTPQVTTDAAGITFFTVTVQVTTTLNGTTQTQAMTDDYVLEGGVWKFWFSQTA